MLGGVEDAIRHVRSPACQGANNVVGLLLGQERAYDSYAGAWLMPG